MQNKIIGWEVSEIKELLTTISEQGEGKITQSFGIHAQKYNRKPTSVRNFYYNFLKAQSKNVAIQNIFMDILPHLSVKDSRRFNEISEQSLLMQILDISDKCSVRQKCLKLADYDKQKFLRYQNKYQNLLKNKPNLVQNCINLLKKSQKPVRIINFEKFSKPKNIITMPAKSTKILSDTDINSLFVGLVNLVKQNTKQADTQSVKNEINLVTNALQKSLVELRKKDNLIRELTEQNNQIKNRLSKSEQQLEQVVQNNNNTLNTITTLANSKKIQKLRDFLQKITTFDTVSTKNPI